MENKIINKIRSLNISNLDVYINEAKFGFSYIKKYCKNIRTNGKVLEVGCGSGILLYMLTQKFDDLIFEGIEPHVSGFNSLLKINQIMKNTNISIKNVEYEEFNTRVKYDLIYCINVFEHVDSWRNFLLKISKWLNKDGKIVILAPNYGFPYEPHFGIPIIVNKSLTFSVFKKYIIKHEKNTDSQGNEGLWDSLNFVKKRQVVNFIESQPSIMLIDDISIIDFMINRLTKDKEFRKRQKLISLISLFVQKNRLLKILKLFPMNLPYMKLEIRRV